MRELDCRETELVAGGEWEFEVDFGITKFVIKGPESIQEMAAGAASVISDAYSTARDATADMYEWIANGWAFSATCGRGY